MPFVVVAGEQMEELDERNCVCLFLPTHLPFFRLGR